MFTESERASFVQGYTEAMQWANTYSDDGEPFDALDDIADWQFEHSSMVRIEEVCGDFLTTTEPMLRAATMISDHGPYGARDMAYHGHDLALTQNGHGAGFWDRGYPHALGDALTDAAHAQGEAYAYVTANGGLVYEG